MDDAVRAALTNLQGRLDEGFVSKAEYNQRRVALPLAAVPTVRPPTAMRSQPQSAAEAGAACVHHFRTMRAANGGNETIRWLFRQLHPRRQPLPRRHAQRTRSATTGGLAIVVRGNLRGEQRQCLASMRAHLIGPYVAAGHRVDVHLTMYKESTTRQMRDEVLRALEPHVASLTLMGETHSSQVRTFLIWQPS